MARISKNVLKSPIGFSKRVRYKKSITNETYDTGLAPTLVLLARRFRKIAKPIKEGICPRTK